MTHLVSSSLRKCHEQTQVSPNSHEKRKRHPLALAGRFAIHRRHACDRVRQVPVDRSKCREKTRSAHSLLISGPDRPHLLPMTIR